MILGIMVGSKGDPTMAEGTILLRITVFVDPSGDISILAGADEAILDTPEKTAEFTTDLSALVGKYLPPNLRELLESKEATKAPVSEPQDPSDGVEITVRTLRTLGVWERVVIMKGLDPNEDSSTKIMFTEAEYDSLNLMREDPE